MTKIADVPFPLVDNFNLSRWFFPHGLELKCDSGHVLKISRYLEKQFFRLKFNIGLTSQYLFQIDGCKDQNSTCIRALYLSLSLLAMQSASNKTR
jgi:hypothetical protein